MDIIALLNHAKAKGASDLHLATNRPPVLRINGFLHPISGMARLTAGDVQDAFAQITTEKEKKYFSENLELDFAYTIPNVLRVRCNAAMQRASISLSMRLIPTIIPSFEQLHLPEVCREMALKPRGMIVISGPTGSGKSTTLAAMIEYLNNNQSRRIVTIEDPIEYVYSDNLCTIIQRELGDDTRSFVDALKHVLRQDPDIILVGEMRDVETAAAALTVAETGHLVITTGHAPSAPQTIERIIDLFPPAERHLAQTRLASLLVGIMCQTLVPTIESVNGGRVPAIEVMLANPAVRNTIREGKLHQLPNIIRTSSQEGMKLLDYSLVDLYEQKLISPESLLAFCNDRMEVENLCGDVESKAAICKLLAKANGKSSTNHNGVAPISAESAVSAK